MEWRRFEAGHAWSGWQTNSVWRLHTEVEIDHLPSLKLYTVQTASWMQTFAQLLSAHLHTSAWYSSACLQKLDVIDADADKWLHGFSPGYTRGHYCPSEIKMFRLYFLAHILFHNTENMAKISRRRSTSLLLLEIDLLQSDFSGRHLMT